MIIEKKYNFYSGHRDLSVGENNGKLHINVYNVICYFQFNEINNGITMLFSDIDNIVEPIIKQYNHRLLLYKEDSLCNILKTANEPFMELPVETSLENISMWLSGQIKQAGLPIIKLELAENKTSNVIFNL
jgi:6-pyruvoyl-tetrahydropterin synthase